MYYISKQSRPSRWAVVLESKTFRAKDESGLGE